MANDQGKRRAAEAALQFVEEDSVIGVGTGSTVDHFIAALGTIKGRLEGAVASSKATAARLKQVGIPLLDLNAAGPLPLYVDGADEANRLGQLIKGGGGALTGEKIIAAASKTFICIIDDSKLVDLLGRFPVAVEVIPMARSQVGRALLSLGGQPVWRENFVTDHGHWIIDVHNLDLTNPVAVERELNQIPGVVTAGLFAAHPAQRLLVGNEGDVVEITPP
ncbi:MAG: ribose-5-phosphate isomerase RpiA [Candidatus Competibacterales bacterium]